MADAAKEQVEAMADEQVTQADLNYSLLRLDGVSLMPMQAARRKLAAGGKAQALAGAVCACGQDC
jgi:hypothetical protein